MEVWSVGGASNALQDAGSNPVWLTDLVLCLEVPEFDQTVSDCNKIAAIF